jgi:hypothetical protein
LRESQPPYKTSGRTGDHILCNQIQERQGPEGRNSQTRQLMKPRIGGRVWKLSGY